MHAASLGRSLVASDYLQPPAPGRVLRLMSEPSCTHETVSCVRIPFIVRSRCGARIFAGVTSRPLAFTVKRQYPITAAGSCSGSATRAPAPSRCRCQVPLPLQLLRLRCKLLTLGRTPPLALQTLRLLYLPHRLVSGPYGGRFTRNMTHQQLRESLLCLRRVLTSR